ncbi:hypothetical protein BJ742DRAFT_492194 [Cladochytrium replicatum]|nr:hypothetical protein BJ742DRAFT_492194 [Cladochytrium replicatum]
MFPERQAWPHGKWGDEVAYLDEVFKPADYETSGYVIGKIKRRTLVSLHGTPDAQADEADGVESIRR